MQSDDVLWPRAVQGTTSFETRLLGQSWVLPVAVALLAAGAAGFAVAGFPTLWLAALLAVGAVVVGRLRAASRITVVGERLCVAFLRTQPRCIGLRELGSVMPRPAWENGWMAPTLELTSRDRRRVTIRLGWWNQESELLAIIADAADRAGALVDPSVTEILRDRPSAEWWTPTARQAREDAARKEGRLARALNRLPRPLRMLVQGVLVVVELALFVVAMFALYFALQLASVAWENVLAPRAVDPAWTTRVAVPATPGDSWVGNLVTDGETLHLAMREGVQGFWGVLTVRSSPDGGETWAEPIVLSRGDWPNAARHTLAIGPDGALYVAWAEQGPAPQTQQLLLRRSIDGGASWEAPVRLSPPSVGLIGLPVILPVPDGLVVGYTDGRTGEVWVQRTTALGALLDDPVRLGVTTRQLYSDADFHDGALALAAAGDTLVAAFVDGEESLRVVHSDDAGRTWQRSRGVDQDLYAGRPRLASDGSTVLLAASDPNREARYVNNPFVRIWTSADGGATFARGPDVTDVVDVVHLELAWADGRWRLLYEACPGFVACATDYRIWYATSADGSTWSEPSVVTDPGPVTTIGLAVGEFGTAAVWASMNAPHAWSFVLARRAD